MQNSVRPDCCNIKKNNVFSVQDAESTALQLTVKIAEIADQIVSLGKALHSEVNEKDIAELVKEHAQI